ncbi:hypothetical protein AB0C59_19765 [Streptomyces sp. NPDC048664]|uniref:hypothetical protein n=1 Tax=Streptomyces sp. NPDC048664 TaxID=3154505 RepID=UPI0034290877
MREKPLSRIEDELSRVRHRLSHHASDGSGPVGFKLDDGLVNAYVSGTIDPEGEAVLAGQVARLLPFHWNLPTSLREEITAFIENLGGRRDLAAWLDRHPGRPRLVARLYVLMGLLDQYTADPGVVAALREYREHTPFPPGLKGHLVPPTDDETLASLGFAMEELLGDGRYDAARDLGLATADWVRQIAPRAAELDPKAHDLAELMEHCRQDIEEAPAEAVRR